MTHGQINAQNLYNHIHLYSDTCFLHVAFELILDTLYLDMKLQMSNSRDDIMITYQPVNIK